MVYHIEVDSPTRARRLMLKITLYELAVKAGVGVSTIALLEKGGLKTINPKLLSFFASRGVNVEELQKDYQEFRHKQQQQAE